MCILCVANFTDDGLTIDFCYFHNSELFEIKEVLEYEKKYCLMCIIIPDVLKYV